MPPRELHEFDELEDRLYDRNNPNATHELPERALVRFPEARPYFAAMLQALDTEIGRLITHIEEDVDRDTYIIFLSDNGTSGEVAMSERPQYRFKGTVYEDGIRVPLVISGPKIEHPGRRVDELVNITDLYSTIVELAGGQKTLDNMRIQRDSRSLTPYFANEKPMAGRSWIYAERGAEADPYVHAVRGKRYKLILSKDLLQLFDLETDKHEENNLMNSSMSMLERKSARELFSVFQELYDSEDDPFTDVDPGELIERYGWLFCDRDGDQNCVGRPR